MESHSSFYVLNESSGGLDAFQSNHTLAPVSRQIMEISKDWVDKKFLVKYE